MKIAVGSELLLFSLDNIFAKIRANISPEIVFDLYTTNQSTYHLFKTIDLIAGKLYLNYGIKESALQEARNASLVTSSIKTGLMFLLFSIFNVCLIYFYRTKETVILSKELGLSRRNYDEISNSYKRLKSESALINFIFIDTENDCSPIDIGRLCNVLAEYFNWNDLKVNCQHHITHLIATNILAKDFYLICTGLLFYKKTFSNDADLSIRFYIKEGKLIVCIGNMGFILSGSKMIEYSEGIDKPSFIMEWWEILLKIKEHNIGFTQANKGKTNLIKLEIPLKEPAPKNNVICLDDYR